MVRDVAGWPSLDGIVWTLEIEVKFYLLCALLAPALRRGLVFGLAALIHHGIEVPSDRFGKRLAARLGRPAGATAPPTTTAPPAVAKAA
jgi:peptidoglycan/LPS O-acetylase OafA/YrhL